MNIFFAKKDKNLFVRPNTKLFSKINNGRLKILDANDKGKETYPPKPKIKCAFSFFIIIMEINTE